MSSSLPVGSKLIFLSDLPTQQPQDKVRFLGCVERYDVLKGRLTLVHNYPKHQPTVVCEVTLDLVLESVRSSELQIGAWVSVIGCVCTAASNQQSESQSAGKKRASKPVEVQAVMLWNAGPIKIDDYERAVEARKAAKTNGEDAPS